MKFLKRFVLLILLLVLVLIGIGYVLPEQAHVERDVLIDAPPQAVFTHLNDLRRFNEWSPWARDSAAVEYGFSGPDSGVGARMYWRSDDPELGSGSILITQSRPPERLTTRLDLGDQGTASAYFTITPAGNGSRVTWGFDGRFDNNIIQRYFGLMMERWIGQDYERGLRRLKARVENQATSPVDDPAPD